MTDLTTNEVAALRGVSRAAVLKWLTNPRNPLAGWKHGREWAVARKVAIEYAPAPKGWPKHDADHVPPDENVIE